MELPESMQDQVWSTRDGNINSADLKRVLNLIHAGRERYAAFDTAYSNCDRRVDRATQLLRRAGLIEFAGGKWRVVVARVAGDL